MTLRIVGDRLLIKPKQLQKEHSVEGTDIKIALEFGLEEKRYEAATTEGVVDQLGPLAYATETPWCKVGDIVSWGKYGGYWITDPETKVDYVVLDPHDILCVISTGEAK